MNSSPEADFGVSPRIHPLPRSRVRNLWLWPQPAVPGFYGADWRDRLFITTNHLPTLAAMREQGKTILALDSGGLPPRLAAAFDSGLVEDARHQFDQLASREHILAIEIDPALSRRLMVETGNQTGEPRFRILSAQGADRSQILWRLFGVLPLVLGQAIVFTPPLLLFGWQYLAIGICVLFAAGLVLSLLWPLPRRKCLVCRLVLSLISTVLVVGVGWLIFNLEPARLAWLAGGWWLASFWLSLILTGTKA